MVSVASWMVPVTSCTVPVASWKVPVASYMILPPPTAPTPPTPPTNALKSEFVRTNSYVRTSYEFVRRSVLHGVPFRTAFRSSTPPPPIRFPVRLLIRKMIFDVCLRFLTFLFTLFLRVFPHPCVWGCQISIPQPASPHSFSFLPLCKK